MRYWINTVSRSHVEAGMEGGFTQAGHGKRTPLERLQEGDLIAFYSPCTELRGGEPLQQFTAMGRVADKDPYEVGMGPGFSPWRRRVEFFESEPAPIHPLKDDLNFIKNKRHWGHPFRRGLFEVYQADFRRIAAAMKVALDAEP